MLPVLIIKYLSLLAIPFGIWLTYFTFKKTNSKTILIIFLGGLLVFSYTRLIEPQIIITQEHTLSENLDLKVALIADTHLGVYKSQNFLQRVVNKINQIPELDLVLIAGDLAFEPYPNKSLNELFKPFQDLNIPAIAVLGNHDVQRPGPDIRQELIEALQENNIIFLNNQTHTYQDTQIIGLGSHWNNEDDASLLQDLTPQDKAIILTHNPDTVTTTYPEPITQLTLAGHTHGGQIRLPFIYKTQIPTEYPFDKDFHSTKKGPVFVTSGLGEVGLPMRFLIPPVIDILNL